MTNVIDRIRLGLTAFKEADLTSSSLDTASWSDVEARRQRYSILWAQYEQTSYRNIHSFSTAYKTQYGLYKNIRPIYNPSNRLANFWQTHIFGGQLDVEAGPTGAIPIGTDNENLRPAIAEIWKWSRWQSRKDILSIRGTILGDTFLRIIDDVSREKVYLDLVHPGSISDVTLDPFGNVKAYTLSEIVPDPISKLKTVTYTEQVYRNGVDVVYETYRDNELFAWPENVDRTGKAIATWSEPYGFVPLVMIQHNDVGLEWGWSELHPVRAKMQEADDIASMLGDQIRKSVDPIWLMAGMKSSTITLDGADSSTDYPNPSREEVKAIWNVPANGKATAMVANLDYESALSHLQAIITEMERDIPELSPEIQNASGNASGRALRTARQPVISKVVQRRANYDAGLVAAQQMAIAIGGFRGYPEYSGFDLDSYAKGELDHEIIDREVFRSDPLDDIEITSAQWAAAKVAIEAGVSLEGYLVSQGWEQDKIDDILNMEIEDADTG